MERPRYSMVIAWSDEDDAYINTVPELPGCMTHAPTYEAAARAGEDAIVTWLMTARAWGDPVPAPRLFMAPPAIGLDNLEPGSVGNAGRADPIAR